MVCKMASVPPKPGETRSLSQLEVQPLDMPSVALRRFVSPFEECSGNDGIIWVFPKIGVPQNGWIKMENPIKMDDLGVPLFLETPM